MKTNEPHHIQRTRIADNSVSAAMGFENLPRVGTVRYSKTFPSAAAAQREADAWNSTGDWSAVVIAGRAPRAAKTSATA